MHGGMDFLGAFCWVGFEDTSFWLVGALWLITEI